MQNADDNQYQADMSISLYGIQSEFTELTECWARAEKWRLKFTPRSLSVFLQYNTARPKTADVSVIAVMFLRPCHTQGLLFKVFAKQLRPISFGPYLSCSFQRGSRVIRSSSSTCLSSSHNRIMRFRSSRGLSVDTSANAVIDDVENIAAIGRELLDGHRQCIDGETQKYLTAAANLGHIDSGFLLGTFLLENCSAKVPSEAVEQSDEQMSPESRAAMVKKEIKDATQIARSEKKIRIQKQKNSLPIQSGDEQKISDEDLGLEWLRWASRKNHGGAMCYLGNILLAKDNADDNREAVLWYEKAANLLNPSTDALFNLGTLYFNGREGVINQDLLKSFSCFKRAADLGDSSSQFWIGYCYFTGEGADGSADGPVKPQLALKYLTLCSGTGHSSALYYLATLYRSGLSSSDTSISESENIPPNKELFLKYLMMSVDAEDPDALFCLGDLYLNSSNNLEFDDYFPRDEKRGRELYSRASELGHVEATVCLGAMYYHGMAGLEKDARKAFEVYNLAAERGSLEAWRNLAAMYYTGDGIPKSEDTAKEIMRVMFGSDQKVEQ